MNTTTTTNTAVDGADIIAALPSTVWLCTVDYSERLDSDDVQTMLDGKSIADDIYDAYMDERFEAAAEIVAEACAAVGVDMDDIDADLWTLLVDEVLDRDESDPMLTLAAQTPVIVRVDLPTLDHVTWTGHSWDRAEALAALTADFGDRRRAFEKVLANAYGGGVASVLLALDSAADLLHGTRGHAVEVTFTVAEIGVINTWNGSGHFEPVDGLEMTLPIGDFQAWAWVDGVPGRGRYTWSDVVGGLYLEAPHRAWLTWDDGDTA